MSINSYLSSIPVLSILYLIPLIGAIILFFIDKKNELLIKKISLITAILSFILSTLVFIAFDYKAIGLQFVEKFNLYPKIGIEYYLGVNGINIMLVLLTGIIILAGVLASWSLEVRVKEFFILLLLLTSGVFGVFVSYNFFIFYLFYEIAVLPMYLLIGIWGTGPKEYSAMKLTLYLLLGSALLLGGMLAVYFNQGTLSFNFDILTSINYDRNFQIKVFPFIFGGFAVLAAMWPFHTWSPDGHASAPTAVSMLHAGVLMKLGAYGCLLASFILPEGAKFWFPYIALFSLVNIVYGSIGAVAQKDLKYIVAYSSVSHMGIVILGIASANPASVCGAVLQMFSHGVMTGLFFAMVGMIYGRTHTRIIDDMMGLSHYIPKIGVFFVITGLCSLGLPGLSGFVAELLVFIGAFRKYPLIALISLISIVVTAFYVLRLIQKIFYGNKDEHFSNIPNITEYEFSSLLIQTIFIVSIGIYPFYVLKIIDSGIIPIITRWGGI